MSLEEKNEIDSRGFFMFLKIGTFSEQVDHTNQMNFFPPSPSSLYHITHPKNPKTFAKFPTTLPTLIYS